MKRLSRLFTLIAVVVLLNSVAWANSRVETVRLQSKLVNATLPYNVILPADYNSSSTSRYPVLYLLHGLTGHYTDWISRTNIADYAQQYRLIVVMPEGNDGWYTDSAIAENEKYESYITKELIPDVQQRYRTIDARYGRAIAGLSMGGYGAIKFGLKSPSTFVFAGSMSGVVGIARLGEKETPPGWLNSLRLFGPTDSDTRKSNDVFEIINQLAPSRMASLPYFYFDCGTEDLPLISSQNLRLATLMSEKKIAHEYRQLPGDHSWAYWDRQIQEVLRVASQKLRFPPARNTNSPTPRK